MCGIYTRISKNKGDSQKIEKKYKTIQVRGPDATLIKEFEMNNYYVTLVFHRLSIMGFDEKSTTILENDSIFVVCNGEIYNYKELMKKYKYTPSTNSDCESIIALYKQSPGTFHKSIQQLDGYFAFFLFDLNKNVFIAARDHIGIRPLFFKISEDTIEYASEAKALLDNDKFDFIIRQFPNGHITIKNSNYENIYDYTFSPDFIEWRSKPIFQHTDYETSKLMVKTLLTRAVHKRLVSDRKIGFLVSGGLDSSLVAGIASKFLNRKITTFSIGYDKNSPDLINAREVAKFLGSDHHEVLYTDEDIKKTLPELIYALELDDITTARASLPMYLLSKYISQNTDIKVIFSGEGADELYGGYLYMQNAPNFDEFQKESDFLVDNLKYFDVLRADRTTARWGLEIRVPFLDTDHYNFVSGLDPVHKLTYPEKRLLRDAFRGENLIPDSILNRKKEAFSDGVGSGSVQTLKRMAKESSEFENLKVDLPDYIEKPQTPEAKMYHSIFRRHFPYFNHRQFYWMPKWSPEFNGDPSATVLKVYNQK